MVTNPPKAEFDRPITLDRLSEEPSPFTDQAKEPERQAIAERLGIEALNTLAYDLEASLVDKNKTVSVTGTVTGEVTLMCSLTLEPFAHNVREEVALRFALPGTVDQSRNAIPHEELELDEAEALFPEVIEGNQVNLGEIAVEALSLALPEYPRAPVAEMPPGMSDEDADDETAKPDTHRPFAKLAVLKDYQRNRQEGGGDEG